MSTSVRAGLFGGVVVVVVVVAIVLVSVLAPTSKSAGAKANNYVTPFSDTAVTSKVTHVPASELDAAGSGGLAPVTSSAQNQGVIKLNGTLTSGGKPLVVYLGAEYCPYCAATRWPFVIALSRFGTFTGLKLTASSPLDVFKSTPTLTFASAKYTSPYLKLSTTEELTNHCPDADVVPNPNYSSTPAADDPSQYACNGNYLALQTPSQQVLKLAATYDTAKYFGTNGANGIPFIDFGGKYIEDGALYLPSVLHGLSWSQVVASFAVPNQGVGQAVLSVANRYTAMICQLTGGKPGSVCNSSGVKAATRALS